MWQIGVAIEIGIGAIVEGPECHTAGDFQAMGGELLTVFAEAALSIPANFLLPAKLLLPPVRFRWGRELLLEKLQFWMALDTPSRRLRNGCRQTFQVTVDVQQGLP